MSFIGNYLNSFLIFYFSSWTYILLEVQIKNFKNANEVRLKSKYLIIIKINK